VSLLSSLFESDMMGVGVNALGGTGSQSHFKFIATVAIKFPSSANCIIFEHLTAILAASSKFSLVIILTFASLIIFLPFSLLLPKKV
jgi:hypothetical protein